MISSNLKKLIFSAFFLALGFILPMLIGQIPTIGQMLLPMHIPVFLCGMICDFKYGCLIGFILPILRSLLFSVPVMYPTAIAVAFEMATYGLIVGIIGYFLYNLLVTRINKVVFLLEARAMEFMDLLNEPA
mgnify:CR=1 FL=1